MKQFKWCIRMRIEAHGVLEGAIVADEMTREEADYIFKLYRDVDKSNGYVVDYYPQSGYFSSQKEGYETLHYELLRQPE